MRREQRIMTEYSPETEERKLVRINHLDIKQDVLYHSANLIKPEDHTFESLADIISDWGDGLDIQDIEYLDSNRATVIDSLPALQFITYQDYIDQKFESLKAAALKKNGPTQVFLSYINDDARTMTRGFLEDAYFYLQPALQAVNHGAQQQGIFDILGELQQPEANLQTANKLHLERIGSKKVLPQAEIYTAPTLLEGIYAQYRFTNSANTTPINKVPIPDVSLVVYPL